MPNILNVTNFFDSRGIHSLSDHKIIGLLLKKSLGNP